MTSRILVKIPPDCEKIFMTDVVVSILFGDERSLQGLPAVWDNNVYSGFIKPGFLAAKAGLVQGHPGVLAVLMRY